MFTAPCIRQTISQLGCPNSCGVVCLGPLAPGLQKSADTLKFLVQITPQCEGQCKQREQVVRERIEPFQPSHISAIADSQGEAGG